jgi:hypothetical protein
MRTIAERIGFRKIDPGMSSKDNARVVRVSEEGVLPGGVPFNWSGR